MTSRVVSVHAVADSAADGVADHAELLSKALTEAGFDSDVVAIDWRSGGWLAAARRIAQIRRMRPDLVILHYSHLAWTRRGLPVGLIAVTGCCRGAAPVLLWVHDPGRIEGFRLRHRVGSLAKHFGLRLASAIADFVVVTVDPGRVYWLDDREKTVAFCPSPTNVAVEARRPPLDRFTVACFGTGLTSSESTVHVLEAVGVGLATDIGPFRLRVLGANPPIAHAVRDRLEAVGVDVEVPGLVSADQLGELLAASHVFCHVRGTLTSRSGTLAAALACGLPVVGMIGDETGAPLDEGGLEVVGDTDVQGMVAALARLARDSDRQDELAAASLRISSEYYSWKRARDVVAAAVASIAPREAGTKRQ